MGGTRARTERHCCWMRAHKSLAGVNLEKGQVKGQLPQSMKELCIVRCGMVGTVFRETRLRDALIGRLMGQGSASCGQLSLRYHTGGTSEAGSLAATESSIEGRTKKSDQYLFTPGYNISHFI